ncbi:serpin [Dermatophagoides farinae]|uniref:Serpin n=1 Tax=Dermatophagoides farinae TaxID=6954 RepID=A0A922HNP5_DERFA|nr:serpin [Dermatophagoides farinae]
MSYGMRRLATSLNQFGMDLARSMEMQPHHTTSSSYSFCPFCVGTSLAILMAGLEDNGPLQQQHQQQQQQNYAEEQFRTSEHATERLYDSLRYALYLNSMQPQEVHLAFLDLMRHLQVNLPVGFSIQQPHNLWEANHRNHGLADDVMFIVNQVYVQRYIPMDYRFYRLVQRYYQTPIRSLDFAYAPEESWHHINAKVEHETQGRIDHVLDSQLVTSSPHPLSSTRLLFLSGLHFRARLDFRQLVSPAMHDQQRRRRGALQRLWPLRSPFLPPANHHQILFPALVHSNHHQPPPPPPINRPPFGLLFKPCTASPVIALKLSSTTTAAPVQNTHHMEHAATFNPFEPLLLSNDKGNRVAVKKRIRLRYQHNDYLNSTVIELPFVGGTVSLLILLPDSLQQMPLMLSRFERSADHRSIADTTDETDGHNNLLTLIGLGELFTVTNDNHSDDHRSLAAALVPMMQISHKCMIDMNVIDDDDDDDNDDDEHNDWSGTTQDNKIAKKLSHQEDAMKHISLQMETFIYLIIDNVSGLILVMGKHGSN